MKNNTFRTIKDWIWVFFMLVIPVLIFFSPIYYVIKHDNILYMFAFMVSWIPALGFAALVQFFHEHL